MSFTTEPSQATGDRLLSLSEAFDVCGPPATLGFLRANGRFPRRSEAKEMARLGGWFVVGSPNAEADNLVNPHLLDRVLVGRVFACDRHDGAEVFSSIGKPELFEALEPLDGRMVRVTIEVLDG